MIALGRIGTAIALLLVLAASWAASPKDDPGIARGVSIAAVAISGFLTLGVASWIVARARYWRPWIAFALITFDALLLSVTFWVSLSTASLPGAYASVIPVAFAVPVLLALGALRYRPGLQIYATALTVTGILVAGYLASIAPTQIVGPRTLDNFFSLPQNGLRLVMVITVGIMTALAGARARGLLNHAVHETVHRNSLTRFLPAEIAPLIANSQFADLRRGRRQKVAVMFVDMRDSTARAEAMDPARVSIFISAFRRRVTRAVAAHGGIIDKFIGDGAMVVFGAIEPQLDDTRRAFDCARAIARSVTRWNDKRNFEPAVQIGIGIHFGDAYCGIIGDHSRLEFTVIGDAVNVASRIETQCKILGVPFLASQEAVAAAGEAADWREISGEPLPGRVSVTIICQPVRGAEL